MGVDDGYRRNFQGLIDDLGDTGVALGLRVHLLCHMGAHRQLHKSIL